MLEHSFGWPFSFRTSPSALFWIPYNLVLLRARQGQHPLLNQLQFQALLAGQILDLLWPWSEGIWSPDFFFFKGFPKSGLFLVESDSKQQKMSWTKTWKFIGTLVTTKRANTAQGPTGDRNANVSRLYYTSSSQCWLHFLRKSFPTSRKHRIWQQLHFQSGRVITRRWLTSAVSFPKLKNEGEKSVLCPTEWGAHS